MAIRAVVDAFDTVSAGTGSERKVVNISKMFDCLYVGFRFKIASQLARYGQHILYPVNSSSCKEGLVGFFSQVLSSRVAYQAQGETILGA